MKKLTYKPYIFIKTLYIVILIFSLFSTVRADSYKDYNLRLSDFLQHNFAYNHFGIIVQSLYDNKILYQHNQHKLFVPASLIKLFTLATSLEKLTPNFKFKTQLCWNKNKVHNGKLKDDLALIFSGDPSFTQKNLEDLIVNLKKYGIYQIEGDITIDDTLFAESYPHGLVIDDLAWGYAAPSETIVIAENKIPIIVNPMNILGQNVDFSLVDSNVESYRFNINSEAIAVTQAKTLEECSLKVVVNASNDIFFSGCVAAESQPQAINLALNSPRKYLQDLIMLYFRKYNINLIGKVFFTKVTKNFSEKKINYSLPLNNLLQVMMRHSNNIYAHSIGKTLGVKFYGAGTFKTASNAITSVLHKNFSVNTSTLNIVDSSGLSVYNVATPNHFIRLLQAIYNDRSLYSNIIEILSKPGDGSLKNRLTAKDLRNNVIAKTGTLKHSLGFAGYINNKKGVELGLVFMINDLLHNDFKIKQLVDEMVELLINYS